MHAALLCSHAGGPQGCSACAQVPRKRVPGEARSPRNTRHTNASPPLKPLTGRGRGATAKRRHQRHGHCARRSAVRPRPTRPTQVDVGSQAMQLLVNVLRDDRADTEITNYALETLVSVTSPQETVGAVPRHREPRPSFLASRPPSHPSRPRTSSPSTARPPTRTLASCLRKSLSRARWVRGRGPATPSAFPPLAQPPFPWGRPRLLGQRPPPPGAPGGDGFSRAVQHCAAADHAAPQPRATAAGAAGRARLFVPRVRQRTGRPSSGAFATSLTPPPPTLSPLPRPRLSRNASCPSRWASRG